MSQTAAATNQSTLPLDLPFVVLEVTLRAQQTVYLPPFAGSKLEGAFGRALHWLACTQTERETCQGCQLQSICSYGLSYAPLLPNALKVLSMATPPRPVIFRTAHLHERQIQTGETFSFGLVVVGKALGQLPYLLAALREVGQGGIGRTRGRMQLEQVCSVQPYSQAKQTLLQGDKLGVQLEPLVLNAADLPDIAVPRLRLHFYSLVNLQHGGRMLERPDFAQLVRALQRRISNLEQVHGGGLSAGADYRQLPQMAESVRLVDYDLQPISQLRKGHKGKLKTNMQGLTGWLEYQGELAAFGPLLRFGEQLGVGKWAHFGAGGYRIELLEHSFKEC